MTKVTIVSGFLGAGKTTFIKKLISQVFTGEQLVLIENEFGEIGIDGGFLKEAGVQITEMNSGCICCSLVGDFGTALKEVLETYHPDRILIEPSGVGKLSDVVKAVRNLNNNDLELTGSITVVDAMKGKMYHRNFGEFFDNQISEAQTIVLSRTGNMKEENINQFLEILRSLNETASIITTPWEQLEGEQIKAALNTKNTFSEELLADTVCPTCGHVHDHDHEHHHDHEHEHHHDHEHEHHHDHEHEHHHDHEHEHHHDHEHEHHHEHDHKHHHEHEHDHHHEHEHEHHHADEVFTSLGMETPHKYTQEELETALHTLSESQDYGVILRAKGIVSSIGDAWFHFDLTPGEFEIREGGADFTGRLCVIGTNLKEAEIKELLKVSC